MAATTVFDTIDALVALITGLPACANSNGVAVFDGYPGETASNIIVTIGGTTNPTATVHTTTMTLGAQQAEEVYDIEGTVDAFSGGTIQKTPRDMAKTVFEAIHAAVRAAFQPGGNGLGVANLLRAEVYAVDLKQTDLNDDLTGRSAVLTFRVRCTGWI